MVAQDLGKRLASLHPPIRLLDGQSEGIGRTVANAFGAVILHSNQDLRERVRFFPNPYAVDASMSNNPALLPKLKAWRASLFRSARTVVVFEGGMGTQAEVDVAQTLKCNIIPVPGGSGGLTAKLLTDPAIKGRLDALDPSYVGKAASHTASVSDVIAVIEKSFA